MVTCKEELWIGALHISRPLSKHLRVRRTVPLFLALPLVSRFKNQVTLASDNACILKLEEANPLNLETGIGPKGADYLAFPQLERESRDYGISPRAFEDLLCMPVCSFRGVQAPANMQREKVAGRVAGNSPSGYGILALICMNVTAVSPKVVKHFCKPRSLSFIFIWLSTRHCPKNVYQKPDREIVIWFRVFISFKWKNLARHWQRKADRFGSMGMPVWAATKSSLDQTVLSTRGGGVCSSFSWDSQN